MVGLGTEVDGTSDSMFLASQKTYGYKSNNV